MVVLVVKIDCLGLPGGMLARVSTWKRRVPSQFLCICTCVYMKLYVDTDTHIHTYIYIYIYLCMFVLWAKIWHEHQQALKWALEQSGAGQRSSAAWMCFLDPDKLSPLLPSSRTFSASPKWVATPFQTRGVNWLRWVAIELQLANRLPHTNVVAGKMCCRTHICLGLGSLMQPYFSLSR